MIEPSASPAAAAAKGVSSAAAGSFGAPESGPVRIALASLALPVARASTPRTRAPRWRMPLSASGPVGAVAAARGMSPASSAEVKVRVARRPSSAPGSRPAALLK